MGRFYMLSDDKVVEEPDFKKWLQWHQSSYEKERCVAQTYVKFGEVKTIFLGMNMRESETEPPWLFDTRVYGGWLNGKWERSSTIKMAAASHEAWVAKVREMESNHEDPPPDAVW